MIRINNPLFNRLFLLCMPPLLIGSTFVVFRFLTIRYSMEIAFLGYLFYWGFWGICIPLWFGGVDGLQRMFTGFRNGVKALGGKMFLLFSLPPALYLIFGLMALLFPNSIPEMPAIDLNINPSFWWFLLGIPAIAVINGTLEEVIWRGMYLMVYPKDSFMGYIYSGIWFGPWHLSPMMGILGISDIWNIIEISALGILLGLVWGKLAYRTGGIKWCVISHILANVGHVILFIILLS